MVSVAVARANDGTLVLAVASCTEPSEAGETSSCGLERVHTSYMGSECCARRVGTARYGVRVAHRYDSGLCMTHHTAVP